MHAWTMAGIGFNIALGVMALAWYLCKRIDNASYGDAAWFFGFTVVAAIFGFFGSGDPTRRAVIATMVGLWSLRLGFYLLIRIRRLPAEDARYRELREQFPKRPWHMFFGFFMAQAIMIGLLATPFAIACGNRQPGLAPLELFAAGLWVVAFLGEAIADFQLAAFRARPENAGKVLQTGLWRFSRHPNYFFEVLIWIAYFLFAAAAPWGWVSVYCPLLMIVFLVKFTGIPPSEAQALKSRGEPYRTYQRRTSALVPWLPKAG